MSWIVEPFLIQPEVYGWMAPFALVLMALGGGLFWAIPVGLSQRISPGAVGLVLALTLSDLARGYILTGFPWALLGHVWLDTPVAQAAAFVGPAGLSLFTLALAAGLSERRARPVGTAVLALALVWGGGMWRLAAPEPAAAGPVLRLVQPNAAQEGKWDPALAEAHFATLLAESAAPGRVDLVIWPETALPYLIERSPEIPMIIARAAKAPVMLGLQRVEGERGWNSLRVQDATGARIASYDKAHLVPFGEYIPFGDLAYEWFGLRAFAAQLGQSYTAGSGPQVLDLGALGKVLPLICYEAVFPQDLRAAPQRAGWIVQITNDAWFGTRTGPFQHAAQARLRAIEQGLPLARVANTGLTEMIDARGQVVAALPFGTKGHLDVALPGALAAPPYARWGEVPLLVLLAGCAFFAFRRQIFRLP